MKQDEPTYRLLNKKQAARFLAVSVASVERLMRSQLKYVRVGGLVRFRPEDLASYLDQNARGGMAA